MSKIDIPLPPAYRAYGPEGEKRHGLQNTKGVPNQSMPILLNETNFLALSHWVLICHWGFVI
jgi:hypothetical protein